MQVSRSSSPASGQWKEAYAREVLADLVASGLSQAEYCRARGIRTGLVSFWRTRLARGTRAAFVPVVVRDDEESQPAAHAGCAVEVVLENGWIIRVHEGCARSNVEKVLAAASGLESREAGRC